MVYRDKRSVIYIIPRTQIDSRSWRLLFSREKPEKEGTVPRMKKAYEQKDSKRIVIATQCWRDTIKTLR